MAVPDGGLRWTIDTATWELSTGQIWLQEPTSSGKITGLVFEGRGRFRMGVPDSIELAQLRQFVEEPELEQIDYEFTHLVLRFAGQTQQPLSHRVRGNHRCT